MARPRNLPQRMQPRVAQAIAFGCDDLQRNAFAFQGGGHVLVSVAIAQKAPLGPGQDLADQRSAHIFCSVKQHAPGHVAFGLSMPKLLHPVTIRA